MSEPIIDIEEILESILRGAAKILGCNSANFIIFNDKREEARVAIGTSADSHREVGEIERLFGHDLQNTAFRIQDAWDTLIVQSWRERKVMETTSFSELVGSFIPPDIVETITDIIGEHSFICVPVVCGNQTYGDIVFEKEGHHSYSPQQREVMLRYAKRLGEIIENNVRGLSIESKILPTRPGSSIQNQLLHLTMGQSAPSVMVDPAFRVTSLNDAVTRDFGYSPEELLNQRIDVLFRDPEDTTKILNHQFLALTDGYFQEMTVFRHKTGHLLPGKVEAMLLVGDESQVIGFLVMIRIHRDVGGARDSKDGFNDMIKRERLATMGEMAAQLAHEIRNPLLAIGATLESLKEELPENHSSVEVVESLRREVSRMDMFLRDYLSLAGKHGTTYSMMDITKLVMECSHLLSGTRKQAGKEIDVRIPPGLSLHGDFDALKQVVMNLLINALEASSPGGQVQVRAMESRDSVTLWIDDEGPGLDCHPEDCFEPFYTRKSNGTGLGLSVCRQIVAGHGGVVTLRNREEGGCRAAVILPRSMKQ